MLKNYKRCSQDQYEAYVDVYNQHGFKGFEEPIQKVVLGSEYKAWTDNNSLLVMQIENRHVSNVLLFNLVHDRNIYLKIRRLLHRLPYLSYTFCSDISGIDKYNNFTKKTGGEKWTEEHHGKIYYFYKLTKEGIDGYIKRVS